MSSPTEQPTEAERTLEEAQQNENQQSVGERGEAADAELVEHDAEQGAELETEHVFDDDIEMQENAKADSDDEDVEKLPSANELSDEDVDPSQLLAGDDPDEETLFSNIYTTPASVPGLVTAWMAHIQTNGPAAVASILSMVVNISRAIETPPPDVIDPEAVISNDPSSTVATVRDIIASDSHGRVIITAKDSSSRRVRRAYEDFWRRIAAEATDVVLYDTDCFDTLITWLDAMASSPSRSLRLAACLGAYRMVDGFVEMGNKLRKQLASMQRQLNTEKRRCGIDDKRKKPGIQLSQKGKELVKKVDALTANNSELIELSDKVFRTLFVVKYRDISPDIRNASVSALGAWILSFPDHFLDDTNNKYIGWLLSDKDPLVRKSSIDALLKMLKKKDFFASLELFLKRFSNRIVEMTRDKDDHVSVGAIALLTSLIEQGIVENEACEQVCEIAIEEPHTEIRRAAGEFMSRLILTHYGNARQTSPKHGRSKKTSDGIFNAGLGEIPSVEQSREYIKELLFAVLRKADDTSTPYLAVDSVWNFFPAVRCWQAFSDLLLEERPTVPTKGKAKGSRKGKGTAKEDEDGLNDFDKAILCEMLLVSAVEASGDGDAARARLVEKGERLHPEPPAVLLSQHFLPLLPKLLSHFQTDLRALCALVKLPIHFSPKVFDQDGQDMHFAALLTKIIDVLTRNTASPEVSSACAETLRSLLSDDNPLKQHTITALQAGCIEAAKDLTLQVRSNLSEAQPDGVASTILRVRILSELVDPGSSLEESVLKLFEYQVEHAETSDLGDDVTTDVARTASALTIWSLARVRSRLESYGETEGPADSMLEVEEVKDLRRLSSSVVDLLHRAFSSSVLPIAVRVKFLQAFLTMSTLALGIGKTVLSNASGKEAADDARASSCESFDILNILESIPLLVRGVKKCMVDLMEHQLELKDHSLLSSQSQRNRIYPLPNEDVRNCFASLVQASFQSAFSSEISHLPLLGLLLKRSQREMEPTLTEFTGFHLCRKYCQQRQLRESSLIKDEVRVLSQVAKSFDVEGDQRQGLVRELAEALLSSRQHGELKITAANDLLRSLMDYLTESPEGDLALNVEILCNAGFSIWAYLSQSDASSLLGESEVIQKRIEDSEEGSSGMGNTFDIFHRALEAVSKGETPDVPKYHTKSVVHRRRRKRTKKRRRTSSNSARQVPSPTVANLSVRRSSREKKPVNYARMQGLEDNFADESDELESSDEDEQTTPKTTDPTPSQDAAAMARNLMRYGGSPRPPVRDTPEVPKNALNPRKRGRPSKQKSPDTGSPRKSASDYTQLEAAAVGVRRSSRARRSSAKAMASQESEGTPTNSRRGRDKESAKASGAIETNGVVRENTDNAVQGQEHPSRPGEAKGREGSGGDIPAPESFTGEECRHDEEGKSSQQPKGTSTPSHATAKEKESSQSPPEQTDEQLQASTHEDGAAKSANGVPSSSASIPEKDTPVTHKTPPRAANAGKSSSQAPRRSPRKLSSPSTGSSPTKSRSPAKGRVEKSPRSKPGQASNYSQANKENVHGGAVKADGDDSKYSKIRRRRRRQW